ncbi:uncharacterized protein BJ171DRAFT_511658 [Polychytrium aggregatum]|uniref:uncharacterized protein n=1 Tax=Polychytrium aggregatum TaxID=110093 RepID=UPI0022FEC1AF|nr:uncharacterized protein BJ171DRAFT_511658 [Polychytrium aggregatum]KAI9203042.1 hypothetical protein BJ171DRAFT_511658 [Polychytrium aggregatum]
MRERIQLSKDILDQELEELTAQLFDQANKMVIDEARMRDNLENANKELRCELKDWIRRFETRGEELKDLQRSLRALQAAKARSASITALSPGTSVANLDQLSGSKIYRMAYGQLPVDGYIFIEFQDHIKQTALASSLPPSQAQATTQSTLFMRRCMVEDIEPCLFYNYQHPQFAGMNLTLFFKPGAGMSSAFKRKLLDGTMRGSLLFTPFYSSTESLPAADPIERLDQDRRISTVFAAGPPPKTRCTICTVVRDCEYRMRFSSEVGASPTGGPSSSAATIEWMSLCRFCRERVIAVTDFFTYINHLRQGAIGPGKQGASLLGIYRHVLYLRRRMASTRIGSGAMFEVDPATNPDWEKMIQILN